MNKDNDSIFKKYVNKNTSEYKEREPTKFMVIWMEHQGRGDGFVPSVYDIPENFNSVKEVGDHLYSVMEAEAKEEGDRDMDEVH